MNVAETGRRSNMPRRISRWLSDRPIVTTLIFIAAVTVPGYCSVQNVNDRQEDFISCVSQWGTDSTERTETLTDLSQERTAALDRLIRAVAQQDPELFRGRITEYIATSDAYEAALEDNPIPEAPDLRCNNGN
jgi:hypothetical protein